MNTKKSRLAIFFLILCGSVILVSPFEYVAAREDFKVIKLTLKAEEAKLTGNCPLRVRFSGSITANGAGTVKYTFTRSDGATGPVYAMTFKKAGTKPISTEWSLGDAATLPRYEGWQAVKILGPNEMESSHQTGAFALRCVDPK